MNMPKSRDIQAKIPLPQAIWNEFWLCYCERSEQYQQVESLIFTGQNNFPAFDRVSDKSIEKINKQ